MTRTNSEFKQDLVKEINENLGDVLSMESEEILRCHLSTAVLMMLLDSVKWTRRTSAAPLTTEHTDDSSS